MASARSMSLAVSPMFNQWTPDPAGGRQGRSPPGGARGPQTTVLFRMLAAALARFASDQAGSYLVVAGLAMPALVGTAALGTEAGLWLYRHQLMQSATDSAALAAATAFYQQGAAADLATQ